MNLENLKTLKEKLSTSDRFDEVWNYFFDHFGEQPEFIGQGETTEHEHLKGMLELIGKQFFKKETPVTNLMLSHVPAYQFYHGACFINGTMMTVIYFEDIDMGMVAIAAFTETTTFARFSCLPYKGNGDVFMASNVSKQLQ